VPEVWLSSAKQKDKNIEENFLLYSSLTFFEFSLSLLLDYGRTNKLSTI